MSISCSKIKKEDTPQNITNDKILDRNNTQQNIQFKTPDSTNITDTKKESSINYVVDFDEEVYSIRSILDEATNKVDYSYDLQNEIKKKKEKYKNFNNDIIDSLKYISKTYIDYQLSLLSYTKSIYSNMLTGKNTFSISDRTNKLFQILLRTPLKDDIQKSWNVISKLATMLEQSGKNNPTNLKRNRDLYKMKIRELSTSESQSKEIFNNVFNDLFKVK